MSLRLDTRILVFGVLFQLQISDLTIIWNQQSNKIIQFMVHCFNQRANFGEAIPKQKY